MIINLLIRNGYRPESLRRCIASIEAQTYKDIRVIIANDSREAQEDSYAAVPPNRIIDRITVTPDRTHPFFWNLYCNDLKAEVTDGWFLYLDNDDYLDNKWCLELLSKHLTDPGKAVICQFKRNGVPKPMGKYWGQIVRGKIGGSCIVLHHSQKHIANWDGNRAADFRFITAVAAKLPLKWVAVPVVAAGNKGLKGKLDG